MASNHPDQNASTAPDTMHAGGTERVEVAQLFEKLESGTLSHDEQMQLGEIMQAPAVMMMAMRHETFSGPIPSA